MKIKTLRAGGLLATCLLATSVAKAAVIASQGFEMTPKSFADISIVKSHLGSGGTGSDLGFTASGKISGKGGGALGVSADGHFRFAHLSKGSNRSDAGFFDTKMTAFVCFDSVDLSSTTSNSLSMKLADLALSSNTNDDDIVVRLFLNGSTTGTRIYDTRGGANGKANASAIVSPARYAKGVITYVFDDSIDSVVLQVDAMVDDEEPSGDVHQDGYFIDDILFTGTSAVAKRPTAVAKRASAVAKRPTAALIGLGKLTLSLRPRK